MIKRLRTTSAPAPDRERQEAPLRFELVRLFLQTWSVPNDTRIPVDRLSSVNAANRFRKKHLSELASLRVRASELKALRALRDDLRRLAKREVSEAEVLEPWLVRLPLTVGLPSDDTGSTSVCYRYLGSRDPLAGAVVARVVEAIAADSWRRFKICPDCQTVFYDRTKNRNRIWCGMSAHGPGGRACGSIAKVRSWRERQAARRG
jgi:predicted RNA-binding Zn ribbon-like protein